jgi:hypothetical protein
MSQPDIKNMAASVRERLANIARKTHQPFQEVLQYYAMERFLYRLGKSIHAPKFVLKGALLFTVWKTEGTRPTLDIDLLGRSDNSPEHIARIVQDILETPVEDDGIRFDSQTLDALRIKEDADYSGVRVQFLGHLANARINMQIDIGFGDIIVPSSTEMDYPTLLSLPAPRLLCYSRESAVAEKFEAMVKLDLLNSRMKDFFDIWTMARTFSFDGKLLQQAIEATFKRRKTELPHQAPLAFTQDFAHNPAKKSQWSAFLRKSRLSAQAIELETVIENLKEFLMPPVLALSNGEQFLWIWKPQGPWKRNNEGQ